MTCTWAAAPPYPRPGADRPPLRALYLDSREDVDHYLEVMNDLSTDALTPAASAALLVEITRQT